MHVCYLALDFFESNDQDSDVGPAQNIVPQPPQQGWGEVWSTVTGL